MAIGTVVCPNCKGRFSVDSSMSMRHVQCPHCGESIFLEGVDVKPSEESPPPRFIDRYLDGGNNGNRANATSRYRWGRRYIRTVRWLAALAIVVGIIRGAAFLMELRLNIQNAKEKLPTKTEIGKIVELQNELLDSYDGMIGVLTLTKDGVSGFELGTGLTTGAFNFNDELASAGDVEESLEELQMVKENIGEIKTVFYETLRKLAPKAVIATTKASRPISKGKISSSKISYRSSGRRSSYRFYASMDERQKKEAVINAIECAKGIGKKSSTDNTDKLLSLLQHIRSVFFPSDLDLSIGSGPEKSRQESDSENDPQRVVDGRVMRLLALFDLLREDWTIDSLIEDTESDLVNFRARYRICAGEIKEAATRCAKDLFMVILESLLTAFLLLVFADYLCAHFDMADSLMKWGAK